MNKNKRLSNFEWLRVLAMGMIISLHYVFKGGLIENPTADFSYKTIVLWLITSLCICAVNAYILISGYFLTEAAFDPGRLIRLIVQVLEYSIVVLAVLTAVGYVRLSELTLYDILGYLFPVGTEEYWFVTAYFMMYLMAPILSVGIKALDKKALRTVIVILLVFNCIEKSILPMLLPGDAYGYDFIWFMTLFTVAAYIRLYGIAYLEGHKGRSWAVYLLSAVMIWAVGLIFSYAGTRTGIDTLSHYADIVFHYNYIFVFTASVGLFYIFKNARFDEDGAPARVARGIGRLTFGVYLLHEHPCIRSNWPVWLGIDKKRPLAPTILHMILCLAEVYAAGLIVEYIRSLIHSSITRSRSKQ